jgi:starch synthase
MAKEKVFYIAAECKPFSMVGGIGDVAGELPIALKKQGFDVEVITPGYSSIDRKHITMGEPEYTYSVPFRDARGVSKSEKVEIRAGSLGKAPLQVPVHFIMNSTYFEGVYGTPYTDNPDKPNWDDGLRFSFWSKAVLPLIEKGNPDVVHVNDWHLGYLLGFMEAAEMPQTRVLSIHNIGYQGNIYKPWIQNWEMLDLLEQPRVGGLFNDPRINVNNSVNPLRLAMELAHAVNTVSPNYAKEMTQSRNDDRYFVGGDGLDWLAQRLESEGRFVGILNGMQYKSEPTQEGVRALEQEREAAKKKFSSYFRDSRAFLLGFVGRAVEQKVQLLAEQLGDRTVLEHLLDLGGVNIAFLGTGEPAYEALFSNAMTSRWGGSLSYEKFLACARRGNIISTIAFDRELARQTWLASDGFFVPSLYEPCGITQMQSMELATPPLVRSTGGLADTVVPYGKPNATGFSFDGSTREGVLRALVASVEQARNVFRESPAEFQAMRERAYSVRFTWDDAAQKYAALYKTAHEQNRHAKKAI